jgi:hypothetical protein
MAVWAGTASADSYCVAPATGCTVDLATLQPALDQAAAHAGADTVRLGDATYTTTTNNGFTYTDTGNADPISIVGATAPGSSKIAVPAPAVVPGGMTDYGGLTIANLGGQSSLADLSIQLPTPLVVVPANFPENQRYHGFIDQSNTQVSNVTISSPPAAPIWANGIDSVNNGTQITNSTVSLGSGGNFSSYGLQETNVNAVDTTVTGTTISADQPLRDTNSDPNAELIIDRSTLQARQIALSAAPATVSISNTLIDLGANPSAVAFDVGFENQNSATDSAVAGDGLTVVGSGNNQIGFSVHATEDNTDPLHPEWVDTATANLLDTVIDLRGTNPTAVNRSDDFDGTANVSIDYSSLNPATNGESDGTAALPGAITLGAHTLNLLTSPSGFHDFAAGDYHLDFPGSALIDAGNPADPGPLALDLAGGPRLQDGDGLCPTVRDIGAYEATGSPLDCAPPETTITSGPTGPTAQRRPVFGFTSEGGATFECSIDSAAFAACTSPFTPSADLADGPHVFAVRASDNASPNPPNVDPTPATRSFTVDATAPTVTVAGKAKVKTKKKRGKAVLTLTASEPGASFQCKLDNAAFVPCSSPYTATRLIQGIHTVKVTATDAVGNAGKAPVFDFRVVRKKKKH